MEKVMDFDVPKFSDEFRFNWLDIRLFAEDLQPAELPFGFEDWDDCDHKIFDDEEYDVDVDF
jgi:hypothetical protein